MDDTKTTDMGLSPNIEGALCYLLGFITGMLLLVVEKKSRFVRFHAMQSLFTFIPLFIVEFVLSWIPFIGWMIAMLLNLLALVLWAFLMFKAFQGETFKLPVVGDMAEREVNKI